MGIYDNDPILDALNAAVASREQARDEYDNTIDGYDREIEGLLNLRQIEQDALDALLTAIAGRKQALLEANLLEDGRTPGRGVDQ